MLSRRALQLVILAIIALLTASGLSACGTGMFDRLRGDAGATAESSGSQGESSIDWVDFIRFNGIMYVNRTGGGRALVADELGGEYARTRFKVNENVSNPSYVVKDGDAAYLAADTPVYAVKGYKPEFRLAAYRGDGIVLYEADHNDGARTGAELLDLQGKVAYIGINSERDGTTELAAIKNKEQVERLVSMVLDAPVAAEKSAHGGETRYFIAFHMSDGTAFTRSYWPSTGELWRGIMLPGSFADAVAEAVNGASGSGPKSGQADAETLVATLADTAIQALKAKDAKGLAKLVHPEQGVLFSPYAHIDKEKDMSFTARQLADAFDDTEKHVWGSFDGSGSPIELTFADYYGRFVYDADFSAAEKIGVNRTYRSGNTVDNIKEVYPGAMFVEYHFDGFDPKLEGHDWKSLRLVFAQREDQWYLTAIVHDQWTI